MGPGVPPVSGHHAAMNIPVPPVTPTRAFPSVLYDRVLHQTKEGVPTRSPTRPHR